jgi:hypothetical protein
MLRWDRLKPEELYQLDLTQSKSGQRHLILRHANDEGHPESVTQSIPYSGALLTQWMRQNILSEMVELEAGWKFVEEAHGGWVTEDEFEFMFMDADEKKLIPKEAQPWINDLPPRLPPK